MASLNLFRNPLHKWLGRPEPRPTIPVKELRERDRRRILRHFLQIEGRDRLLRFGSPITDEQVAKYVASIDFRRDIVFGVYNRMFRLVAVGHLGFTEPQLSQLEAATDKDRVAEFGVSVLKSARGLGIGSKLFERAAIVCRNHDVDTLTMHCLSSNQIMIHIAKKAGMEIHRDYGEADAYLKLGPADPSSVLREAMEEQLATLDYALKANVRRATKLWDMLPGRKK